MRMAVVGAGYVGLSLATMFSQFHEVVAIDTLKGKVDSINERISPIVDEKIQEYFAKKDLDLSATTEITACIGSDFVMVATPTNYCPEADRFDTSSVESVIEDVGRISPESVIVIKSTVPIGFTESMHEKGYNVVFSPEFLREGRALYDNLHPSRIVIGAPEDERLRRKASEFVELLESSSLESDVKTIITGCTEAEAIKLFSNTYLAMRVAYFNELDSFAENHGLDPRSIIDGVCADPRIGDYYNNPSFGYGGYCLPKDTMQLASNYKGTPNRLMGAIVESNAVRKEFVAERIAARVKEGGTIGVHRLIMKSGSDNFRESSIMDVIRILSERGYRILIYEPGWAGDIRGWEKESDLEAFKRKSDMIIANRSSAELDDVLSKVYTRDLYRRD